MGDLRLALDYFLEVHIIGLIQDESVLKKLTISLPR